MSIINKFMFTALLCCSALCAVAPASAATLLPGDSDLLVAFRNTFTIPEGAAEYTITIPGVNYTGTPFDNRALVFTEPGTNTPSDYLFVQFGTLYFVSDANFTLPPGVQVFASIMETGALQDVGAFFALGPQDIQVASDVNTPLPAALPLFAGGLGLIGLLARRRKRTASAAA